LGHLHPRLEALRRHFGEVPLEFLQPLLGNLAVVLELFRWHAATSVALDLSSRDLDLEFSLQAENEIQ